MYRTIPNSDEFNTMNLIDDEIDIALLNDDDFNSALNSIKEDDTSAFDLVDDLDEEDDVDTNIEYTDAGLDYSLEDIDANEIIAAERDIAINPFEDEELVDAATSNDNEEDDIDNINISDLADDLDEEDDI